MEGREEQEEARERVGGSRYDMGGLGWVALGCVGLHWARLGCMGL